MLRGQTIHDEQPPPAREPISSIERQTPRCYEAAKCAAKHLEDEEGRESLAQFVLGVPRAEEVDDTREEDGLGDSQEDAEREERAVILGGSGGCADGAPDCGRAADVCGATGLDM